MSGGHWEYSASRIEELLEYVGRDSSVKRRFPKISRVFIELSKLLSQTEHDLDWYLSGDTSIDNVEEFDEAFMLQMKRIVGKAIPYANIDAKLERMKDILEESDIIN